MTYMPLFFKTNSSRPALIIGGGEIACAKAKALISCDTNIVVASKKISEPLRKLQIEHGFKIIPRDYKDSLIEGNAFVIAATNNDFVNRQVAKHCRAVNIPVNVVDNPKLCDFIFPALVRRGPLQIAISSGGISPVLARIIKQTIERIIPPYYERIIDFLRTKKELLRDHLNHIQPRRLFVETLLNGPIAEEALEGNTNHASELLEKALATTNDCKQAGLYLIGTGPGHPELITLKGMRLISQADVVLYDRLIPPDLIEQYARKDASVIAVGKTRNHHHKKQEDIGCMIERYLKQDKIVVRLKGGDPGIFGHCAEEINIAKHLDVPYHIVPGVSAVTGCAAYSGFPLTERGGSNSLHILTLYSKEIEQEFIWNKLRGTQKDTLAFYMSTPNTSILCKKLIGIGFQPDTPILLIEQGTTPFHREYPATLSTFTLKYHARRFKSPSLVIVGNVTRFSMAHQRTNNQVDLEETKASYFAPLPQSSEKPIFANHPTAFTDRVQREK
ncbi:uroporphyrinogen-III C-methyltransferase [Aliikangiella marina]|uniref:Uroporphyrinogen-III C-methyltransferase n=1 Tax=Aliikangiella marina TaxID=1712262 RepID=A0A545TI02_9GAMM|nr:siroheme synthase CysG [Aliikangiella marina]TQV76853.1 uroporphyrinogen-III C-methyltransferase [Aliikangiella marina]